MGLSNVKLVYKSFKTRPNSPYGGETSSYSLLQQGVGSKYSQMENPEDSTSYIELLMYNLRTRMVARITSLDDMDNKNGGNIQNQKRQVEEQYILGPSYSTSPPGSDILDTPEKVKITLPNTTTCNQTTKFLITLRKLSEAEPFAPGIGNTVFRASVIHFFGISDTSPGVSIVPYENLFTKFPNKFSKNEINVQKPMEVHLEFVGASDTAGYCVDGTPDTNLIEGFINGWKYGNCDYGLPGSLIRLLQDEDTNTGINFHTVGQKI